MLKFSLFMVDMMGGTCARVVFLAMCVCEFRQCGCVSLWENVPFKCATAALRQLELRRSSEVLAYLNV